jgi:hypothetical protein
VSSYPKMVSAFGALIFVAMTVTQALFLTFVMRQALVGAIPRPTLWDRPSTLGASRLLRENHGAPQSIPVFFPRSSIQGSVRDPERNAVTD